MLLISRVEYKKSLLQGHAILSEENQMPHKTPEAGIQQLNLSYDKVQDRLLFRVGLSDNTEVVLWFTYRFSRALWAALNSEAHLPEAQPFETDEYADAVEQFEQEREAMDALESMDFETEYEPREAVGQDGVMLAVSFTLSDEAKHLNVTCLEDVVVNINLTPELVLATCNMLQLASKEAGWELAGGIAPVVMSEASASKTLH